ncbi:hypothetical protein D9758_017642 [Tetrapyrgos nigripes]|uniref:Uncharacterized protein n=1 Tax=Tetrapyrgos nigripes TaxID=182062 RepID=A0A8H5FL44_9AGAR|nr:hypothetical protein D9758_017642 [Tetrapyrgos nigripes]
MTDAVTIVIDGLGNLCPEAHLSDCLISTSQHIDTSVSDAGLFEQQSPHSGMFNSTSLVTHGIVSMGLAMGFNATTTVYGSTPPSTSNQTFVIADDLLHYPQPSYKGALFTLTSVERLTFAEDVEFDYMLLSVTNETDLGGQTILVDDSSEEIRWSGSWEPQETNITLSDPKLTVAAHGNGTHISSTEGDSFTFQFAGTSVQVFGVILDLFSPYTIQATIDGQRNTRKTSQNDRVMAHALLFATENDLAPGNHTLVVTIQELSKTAVVAIDYILYTPSFQTIVDKPVFPLVDATNNTTTSSSTADPTSSSTADPTSSVLSDPGSSKISGGVIAGVTIGGIAFFAVAILALWLWRRKQRKMNLEKLSDRIPEPFMSESSARTHPGIRRKHRPADSPSVPDVVVEHLSTDAKGRRVLAVSNEDQQNLREHRDALEEQMQQMEVQSQAGNVDQTNMEAEMREFRARLDMLTREMGRILVPPSYVSESGEVGEDAEVGN